MSEEQATQASGGGGRRLAGALGLAGVILVVGALPSVLSRWREAQKEASTEAPHRVVRSSAPRQVTSPDRPLREPTGELAAGQRWPSTSLTDLTGRMRSLSEWRGKVVVLNIWATWCPPCIKEMPSLQRLHEATGEDIQVIGISVDDELPRARELAENLNLGFPVLLDPGGDRAAAWGTVKFPETWILGPDGTVLDRVIGERAWDDPRLLAELRKHVRSAG
ncbi:MAG: TlpA disulfide reductase family protein [Acidobacteriota bacterium]